MHNALHLKVCYTLTKHQLDGISIFCSGLFLLSSSGIQRCHPFWLQSLLFFLPHFNFLTIKLYFTPTSPVSSVTLYCTSRMQNRKVDRQHVWVSFLFLKKKNSYCFAFAALCCLPNTEAATALLLLLLLSVPVFFRSDWCGPGKQSMCHSEIQVPRI